MRTLRLLLPLAWRNLWRRGARTALTMAAVAVAVASLIVLESFLRAWGASAFDRAIEALTGHGQIHAQGFLDDPTAEHGMSPPDGRLAAALAQPDVAAWTPRVVAPALMRSERESAPIWLYGVDPEREGRVSFFKSEAIEGATLDKGGASGLVMGKQLADRLQVKLGRRVVISAQDTGGAIQEIGVRVIGFFKGQPDLQKVAVFMPLKKVQDFLSMGGQISEIAYLAKDRAEIERVTDALQTAAPDLDIQRWDQLQPFTLAIIELARNSNAIWVFVSFALAAFGLVNTLMMAVYERMREFGLMQALGMKPTLLLSQILVESIYLVTLATFAGALVGAAIVQYYSNGLDLGKLGVGATMWGASQMLYPQLKLESMAFACVLIIGLSILASLYPAWQAARRAPIDVLTRAQT